MFYIWRRFSLFYSLDSCSDDDPTVFILMFYILRILLYPSLSWNSSQDKYSSITCHLIYWWTLYFLSYISQKAFQHSHSRAVTVHVTVINNQWISNSEAAVIRSRWNCEMDPRQTISLISQWRAGPPADADPGSVSGAHEDIPLQHIRKLQSKGWIHWLRGAFTLKEKLTGANPKRNFLYLNIKHWWL